MSTSQQIRPALGFGKAPDSEVEKLAGAVHTGLDGNVNYPNPPVDLAAFKAAIDGYSASIVAASDGGKKALAEKSKQRAGVIRMLRQLGHYVEAACKDDMSIFLSSGFQAVSTTRTQQPLSPPHILGVDNGNTGQLLVRVQPIRNARGFEVRYAAAPGAGGTPGAWTNAAFTNSRSMPVNGLTPGTTYSFQVRALGSLGYSDWSDFASHMCI